MSGRDKPTTIQDQPIQLHFVGSVPELLHIFLSEFPLPKAYHFILLLDPTLPSYQEIKKEFRQIMYNMTYPCYHVFYYYEALESLSRYIERESLNVEDTSSESKMAYEILKQAVDFMGHCLIIRDENNKSRIIDLQTKEGLLRIISRQKYVQFVNDE